MVAPSPPTPRRVCQQRAGAQHTLHPLAAPYGQGLPRPPPPSPCPGWCRFCFPPEVLLRCRTEFAAVGGWGRSPSLPTAQGGPPTLSEGLNSAPAAGVWLWAGPALCGVVHRPLRRREPEPCAPLGCGPLTPRAAQLRPFLGASGCVSQKMNRNKYFPES